MAMPGIEFFSWKLSSSSDSGIVRASSGIICTSSTANTKTRRPVKRNRAMASAPKKPMTTLISTALSVITRLLRMSSRKIGSSSTSRNARRVRWCGQNCGTSWLMSALVLNDVISIQ